MGKGTGLGRLTVHDIVGGEHILHEPFTVAELPEKVRRVMDAAV